MGAAMMKRRPSQAAYMRQYNATQRDRQRQYQLSKQRWHFQIIRLDHDDAQTLRDLAARERTTVPELIRTFVTWGLEEYEITNERRWSTRQEREPKR
jgi:hypothetical protein